MIARPPSHPDDGSPSIEVRFEDDDGLLDLDLSPSTSSIAAATPAHANAAAGSLDGSEDPRIEDLDAGFDALLEDRPKGSA
jgi:hypothetical protein